MSRAPRDVRARVRALGNRRPRLGLDHAAARQALVALALNASTSFLAGAFLGSITGTLERHPGLLVLVPAAIGLRGNIFSAVGNRLSTSIHTGTFRMSAKRETVLGQNITAAVVLTLVISLVLAFLGKGISVALGVEGSIPLSDMAVVSIVGGMLGSVPVLAATVGMAGGAARFGWDLDNVSAPIVSSLGDVLTLPALWAATALIGLTLVTPSLALVLAVAAVAALVLTLRSSIAELARVVRESLPVLAVACAVSAMAGITIEKRFASFAEFPALLVLLPAFLSSAGALGGILSSRLGSKLHLGTVSAEALPSREARRDLLFVAVVAVPVLTFVAAGAHGFALLIGQASPGLGTMLGVSMLGGALSLLWVLAVAYYGTIAAFRLGVDPDTYGIPIVTSTVDFAGAFALVLVLSALGVGA